MHAKIEIIVTENICLCLPPHVAVSGVQLLFCVGVYCRLQLSVWQGWTFWSAEPCQSAGMLCCGTVRSDPMRGRWWALQKGNKLFQMAGLWWSAQLPQTWSSYSISPARHPVITLSLPLCYAIPDPPAVSGFSLSLSLSLLAKPIILYSVLPSFPLSSAYKNTMAVPPCSDAVRWW